ncbi:hypothetical protein NQ317_008483 [Molorchus minor]|uniref:Scavenger receptor class B member 1 n=1 Tax=Molorchus minor TaxID=1323400 RepID=A0ABQ9JJL2_9CUCU|nr:hypothetical protein NQ317_008483 [Molorchus minor]
MNVTEVGPYTYKEILTNNNASFGDDGTVTFFPRRKFEIDRERSVGDAKVDRIIVPNVPLIGIQAFLQDASFITNLGFSAISQTLNTQSILSLTIDEYLWGYDDKLVTVANNFLPNWIDFGKFGILERLMSRDNSNNVTISTDPKAPAYYKDLLSQEEQTSPYHIIRWNGSPGLAEWGFQEEEGKRNNKTKKCQLVEGAFEGTIFPQHMRPHMPITIFRKAFCRPVQLEFLEETKTDEGFRTYDYGMKDNMFASPDINPDNECYCVNGNCPGKGLQNIGPCYYDMPIVLSKPHFYHVDQDIRDTIVGMTPDPDKHSSLARVQPDIGIALHGSSLKIQVNLGVGKTKFNSKTKPFNDLTVPLFWIELTCTELPSLVSFLLILALSVAPVLEELLKYILLLVGLAMVSGAALLALFFSKTVVPRSLNLVSEYSPLPMLTIPTHYFKSERRICK